MVKQQPKQKSKRNVPLIVTGAIITIGAYIATIPLVHTDFSAITNIVMFAGIIVMLIGFGVSWTREK